MSRKELSYRNVTQLNKFRLFGGPGPYQAYYYCTRPDLEGSRITLTTYIRLIREKRRNSILASHNSHNVTLQQKRLSIQNVYNLQHVTTYKPRQRIALRKYMRVIPYTRKKTQQYTVFQFFTINAATKTRISINFTFHFLLHLPEVGSSR